MLEKYFEQMEIVVSDAQYRITRDMTLDQIAEQCPPATWEKVFTECIPQLRLINRKLQGHILAGETISPHIEEIFEAFYRTPLPNVRVVILGQDPYPGKTRLHGEDVPEACGMSFSGRKGAKIPSSLSNVFRELRNTVPDFYANDGHLGPWAEQGVLLLNRCLTVSLGNSDKSGGHRNIWDPFMEKVISAIISANPRTLFVLWGLKAQEYINGISTRITYKLSTGHPSSRNIRGEQFSGCDHFNKINQFIKQEGEKDEAKGIVDHSYLKPIEWSLTNH